MYRRLLRPLLYLLPAELAHELGFGALRLLLAVTPLRAVVSRLLVPRGEDLMISAFGVTFSTPVGLAAGFDKNARGYRALHALGFGHVEIGTVTAQAQPGNPKPRMFRLPKDEALVNRLGFNNDGAEVVEPRLQGTRAGVLGVNIGKTKRVAEKDAAEDYAASARRLAPHADYLVVNVSSPNTPGLRDLQATEKLRPILAAVQREITALGRSVPLLVKIAPDLSDEDVLAVADLALDLGLSGVVATNTTVQRAGLGSETATVERLGTGGLSGAPLRRRSLQVLRLLRSRVGDRLTLVSVGGVSDPDDGYARIRAGASLLQLYTGFVYQGPFVARRLALGLRDRARRDGFDTVQGAVGADVVTR